MHPYLAAFLKMLECSDRDNVCETKQMKHEPLSMLKGMRTLFALEMWLST